jgi:hypothetical protein
MQQNLCKHCGKKFTRKIIYNRHIILCEILNNPKTKRESQCEKEEVLDIPSHEQMYNIILELAFKCSTLEKKVEELSSYSGSGSGGGGLGLKKPKIHILDWLNANITPTRNFTEWLEEVIVSTNEDIEFLMSVKTNSMQDAMMRLVERSIEMNCDVKKMDEYPHSLMCVSQKQKTFYIYLEEWIICPADQFILLAQIIHSKLFSQLCIWNQKNKQRLNASDALEDQYSNAIGKITGYKFAEESSDMNKLRSSLYQYMKLDLRDVNFS